MTLTLPNPGDNVLCRDGVTRPIFATVENDTSQGGNDGLTYMAVIISGYAQNKKIHVRFVSPGNWREDPIEKPGFQQTNDRKFGENKPDESRTTERKDQSP